ncbi:cadmium-translocating P-type ATPase [Candidatus Dependentiae bacterium]|nr:cadmium-translocating P-type ATPase [Candidatus Dependentiae bacterium]
MKQNQCSCGNECICCSAENLSITCGCNFEAKQFEYGVKEKLKHQEHMNHDMSKMSHQNHEKAMTNPTMAKEMEADMRRRFWIAFILTIPVMLYSHFKILPELIPVNWILFILTTPIVFWCGSIFITGTYYSLKSKKLNMSVLISTGVLAAYFFSVFITFTGGKEIFYDAPAMLITFVLFGHWMEMKSRRGTSDALRALFNLVPPQATIIQNGKEIIVPVADLKIGDIVIIKPGDKIPVDGEIIIGQTTIDESLVTGESIPVDKKIGNKVIGGSINKTGSVQFKVTQVGSDTVLAQIIKLVEIAQNSKAPGQRIADKAAAYLVLIAIGSGIITFLSWYFIAHASMMLALTFAISAIVIACPDALGLATPTAIAVGTGIGAKNNILIKDAATLENTSKIQAIILDKTGTLTQGKPEVNDIVSVNGITQNDLLYFGASAQKYSKHPLSEAFLRRAERGSIKLSENIKDFQAILGHGVKALVDGKLVLVGTVRFLTDNNIDISNIEKQVEKLMSEGKTVSLIAIDGKTVGVISISDAIRPTAKRTIEGLKKFGIEVAMVTGDHKIIAENVAKQIGITRVFAQVLPAEKVNYVKQLQNEKKFVAMVGDGINDAPALAQADIGIAIGAGTDVAIESADIVLMKSDPLDILKAIKLSKATVRKMKQNLFWAAIYNILAIPIAAGILYPKFGIELPPAISALLMSISSIIVATNAVLLKNVESQLDRI